MAGLYIFPPVEAFQWLGHEPGHPLVARITEDDEHLGDWPEERRNQVGYCERAFAKKIVGYGDWVVTDYLGGVRIYADAYFRYLFRHHPGVKWP